MFKVMIGRSVVFVAGSSREAYRYIARAGDVGWRMSVTPA